jgi:hypothetical protein
MTPEQFAFWLHGYFEISRSDVISYEQARKIKENLESCFQKVTPDRKSIDEGPVGLDHLIQVTPIKYVNL